MRPRVSHRRGIPYTGCMRWLAIAITLIYSLASYGAVAAQPAPARAIILEPFASQLTGQGQPGAAEAAALQQAGFTVTTLVGSQVTVPVMMNLAEYKVIYIETHSAILPNGDAVISTGETNNRPYSNLYGNGGLLQTVVAGDPSHALYNAVTGRFFTLHTGTFSPGSILFINGCATLSAPLLWQDLQARGLSTLIGWNGDVPEQAATAVGDAVMGQLGNGDTVSQALASGTSLYGGDLKAYGFHYEGNGAETLDNALTATLPPLPTATATVSLPGAFVPHPVRWGHLSRSLRP